MSSWAVPGAWCECVDHTLYEPGLPSFPFPSKGRPLRIILVLHDVLGRGPHAVIQGWPNGEEGDDIGWRLSRFRPLTKSTKTQEDDIAMFWSILAPTEITKEKEAHHGR